MPRHLERDRARGVRWRAASLTGASPVWFSVTAAVAISALFGAIAADARWLAVLGAYVVQHASVPDFVPYASAPTRGWQNVPVLGELAFHALQAAGGARALLVAQVVAVAIAFVLLSRDMRAAGASDRGAALALLVLVPTTLASLALVRAQLFSLALFPLVVVLIRREARSPSRVIWLLPPIIALWSNLHGAVLVGLAVAAVYLVLERARREPRVAIATLAACVLALFATPALWRTGRYYGGVLDNEAAQRGIGLWSRLSPGSGIDIAVIAGCVLLAASALRSRRPAWELVVLAGLAVLTARAARGSVWFAFFAATPAACWVRDSGRSRRVPAAGVVALLVLAAVGLVRGPHATGAREPLLRRAIGIAAGTPILASDLLAEQVVLGGGRIWVSNPIDAFRRRDQRRYVDWLQGRPEGDAALREAPRVVLVAPGSAPQRRLDRNDAFREAAHDPGAVLYVRRGRLR
jgi:hypothetical protein